METESPDRLWHRTWLVTWQQECFDPLPHSHERWEPGGLCLFEVLMVGYCSTGACDRNWLNRGALGLRRPFIWWQGDSAQRRVCWRVFLFPEAALQSFAALLHMVPSEPTHATRPNESFIISCPQFHSPFHSCLSKNLMGCECRNRKWRWLTATRLVHYHLAFKHKRVYSLYVKRKRENLLWPILLAIGWQTKQISWVFKTCHLGNEHFFPSLLSCR